jgi:predicted TIM-barrel fold metal-dependent hydrolase
MLAAVPLRITNCHVHTFTHAHVPDEYVGFLGNLLLRIGWLRRALLAIVRHFDRGRRWRIARYARIVEVSYERSQRDVFELVRGSYPEATRFVVLPMDMELMGAGRVDEPIAEQHAELRQLTETYPELVIPFAAADPRREDVVETTRRLLEEDGFRGIKLYPPMGYHPADPALGPLYAYAAERGVPVMTHCSRPAQVKYRGEPTERMRTDPVTGERLDLGLDELLTLFTDPDSYRPVLRAHPSLTLCLAHFGGEQDWWSYRRRPGGGESWLEKILVMLRSGEYPNLYTDISYTVFVDEEFVRMLPGLLADEHVRSRVLFGSDFYVVENAKLEEKRISVEIRSVLGEELYATIAEDNPKRYLGET